MDLWKRLELTRTLIGQHIIGDATDLIEKLIKTDGKEAYLHLVSIKDYRETCEDEGWETKEMGERTLLVKKVVVGAQDISWYLVYNPVKGKIEVSSDYSDADDCDDQLAALVESFKEASLGKDPLTPQTWQTLCELDSLNPYTRDAEKYHQVTPWLARRLKANGEIVGRVYHMDIWGCTGAGAALSDEAVLQKIASVQ